MYGLIIALMVMIVAFRYRVGVDSMRFESDIYPSLPSFSQLTWENLTGFRYAPGFVLMVSLLKELTPSFVLYQMVQAVVINVLIGRYLYNNTDKPFVALFCYFWAAFFLLGFETSREGITIALFVSLYSKKTFSLNNLLAIIVCPLIHYGAISILVIYIIDLLRFKGKWASLLSILALVMLVVGASFAIHLSEDTIDMVNNDAISYQYRTYSNTVGDGNILYVIRIILILWLLWLYIRKKRYIPEGYGKHVLLYIALFVMGYYLPITSRIANYVMFDIIIVITYTASIRWKRSSLRSYIFLFALNLFFIAPFFTRVANSPDRSYRRYVPYHSIFFEEKDPSREHMYQNET